MLIPWTPRSVRRKQAPEKSLCERTLNVLRPIIYNALAPFPEARRALSFAILAFAETEAAVP